MGIEVDIDVFTMYSSDLVFFVTLAFGRYLNKRKNTTFIKNVFNVTGNQIRYRKLKMGRENWMTKSIRLTRGKV